MGEIKVNLEGNIDLLIEENTPGLAKLSATRWTVRSPYFHQLCCTSGSLERMPEARGGGGGELK